MIKDALIAIQNRLATIPELKYISEDWGQLDYYTQPPVLWPCALIDCDNISYSDQSLKKQSAVAIINIRIADLRLFDTSSKSPRCEQAYNIFDLTQRVHTVLQGLNGASFAPITRKSIVKTKRDDAIREFNITLQMEYYDSDAVVPYMRLEVAGV